MFDKAGLGEENSDGISRETTIAILVCNRSNSASIPALMQPSTSFNSVACYSEYVFPTARNCSRQTFSCRSALFGEFPILFLTARHWYALGIQWVLWRVQLHVMYCSRDVDFWSVHYQLWHASYRRLGFSSKYFDCNPFFKSHRSYWLAVSIYLRRQLIYECRQLVFLFLLLTLQNFSKLLGVYS